MKAVDVRSSTYVDFNKKINKEDPKFKFSDHLGMSYFPPYGHSKNKIEVSK